MNSEIYRAALAEYLERATDDPEWEDLFRRSADKVLGGLTDEERAKLLEYMGQFSVPSAAFVVREMAAVYALDLYTGREDPAGEKLAHFRDHFILSPAAEMKGKQAAGAPGEVFAAALRRRQGTDPLHRERIAKSIAATMDAFAVEDRRDVEELFARWPDVAVEFTFCTWMWLSDDFKRVQMAGAQHRKWRETGDERIWWMYFDVDA